jgi:hypothetical protein
MFSSVTRIITNISKVSTEYIGTLVDLTPRHHFRMLAKGTMTSITYLRDFQENERRAYRRPKLKGPSIRYATRTYAQGEREARTRGFLVMYDLLSESLR